VYREEDNKHDEVNKNETVERTPRLEQSTINNSWLFFGFDKGYSTRSDQIPGSI
jgi:hypothetical protein